MLTRLRAIPTVAVAVAAAALCAGAATAQAPSHTIVVGAGGHVERIGKLDGSMHYDDARRVFGRPSSVKATSESGTAGFHAVCVVRWSRLRPLMAFTEENIVEARCDRRQRLFEAQMRGSRFRTDRGLRVGDASKTVRETHPDAQFDRNRGRYFLVQPSDKQPNADRLEAYVRNGRVVELLADVH
jgi:hypothetical protein